MRTELKAYLDGELPYRELPSDLREDARAWEELFDELRSREPGAAPAWLEGAVMTELEREADASEGEGVLGWLLRARTLRVSPLGAGLMAAAAAALLLMARPGGTPTTGPGAGGGPAAGEPTVWVQFTLEAPGAASVSLAGDFSDWEARWVLDDPDGDGVWSGRVPLRPGMHEYMFVVDGREWVTDPAAERYADDGFGNRNAVLALPPVEGT